MFVSSQLFIYTLCRKYNKSMIKVYIERGIYAGRVDVPRTIATMDVGEAWKIPPRSVKLQSVRNACSVVNRSTDKFFSVSCPGFSDPVITVTRIK